MTLKLKDIHGNGRVFVSDFANTSLSNLIDNPNPTGSLNVNITANVGANINVIAGTGGSPITLATATFTATSSNIFDGTAPVVHFDADPAGDGSTAMNLFNNFGNSSPNDIMGMLGSVGDLFASISKSQGLSNIKIPFTSLTVGDAINYATAFKHEILDPLFKSGDSTKPDSNGDGNVDINDFNFNGINSLLDRISVAVGLSPGALKATYNVSTGDLKFNFTLDPWFGLGTGAQVVTGPRAVVTTAQNGDGGHNEKQELVVNATNVIF